MAHPPLVQELAPLRSHVCLPGDPVLLLRPGAAVVLGGGLRPLPRSTGGGGGVEKEKEKEKEEEEATLIAAEFCGPVARTEGPSRVGRYAMDAPGARRYICRAKDPVVALVARSAPAYYSCHIGGPSLAVLDALAFDGATKTSRPRLQEGDVVYAVVRPRLLSPGDTHDALDMDVELSCLAGDAGLAAKDWTSGEAVFGPLIGGTVVRVSLPFARSLLCPGDGAELLARLGERVPFEICVGMNGIVWVKGQESAADPAAGARRTVAVASCIVEAQWDTSLEEMEARVKSYFPNNDDG